MFFRARSIMASFCALALLLAMMPLSQVAYAQESVTGEASGVTVAVSDGWSHAADASTSSGGTDSLVFSNGNLQFVVTGGSSDIGESFDLLNISHPVSDIEVAATYALRGVDADGLPFGVFQVAVGSSVQTIIAPVSRFAAAVSDAQSGIQVDGAGVLSGVDGAALAAVIAGSMGSGDIETDNDAPALLGASDAEELADDPAPEDITEESSTEEVAEDVEAGEVTDDTAAEEVTEDSAAEEATEEIAAEDADAPVAAGETGFVDNNTFVSPQFGTSVTWDDTWQAGFNADGEPIFTSFESEVGAYDSVCLSSAAPDLFWTVCFDFEQPQDFTADHFASYADPGANLSNGIPHFGIVLTDSAVSYTSTDLQGNARVVQEEILSGVLIETRLYGELETLTDMVVSVQDSFEIDGQPAFSLLDASTYGAEMDSMMASLPELMAERDELLEAMGLQSPNHYVSAALGCEVAWSDTRSLSDTEMNPINTYGNWIDSLGGNVDVEAFYLSALTAPYVGFAIECYENLPTIESWWSWSSDPDAQQIEGERALYLVRPSGSTYDIAIIVKPVGEPTLIVRFFASAEDIATFQNGEPGLLVMNGIDISELLQEDDLVSQLP